MTRGVGSNSSKPEYAICVFPAVNLNGAASTLLRSHIVILTFGQSNAYATVSPAVGPLRKCQPRRGELY